MLYPILIFLSLVSVWLGILSFWFRELIQMMYVMMGPESASGAAALSDFRI